MPKFQCEKCGALFAGWGDGKICPRCGGKLKTIPWAKYYEIQREQDKASKHEATKAEF